MKNRQQPSKRPASLLLKIFCVIIFLLSLVLNIHNALLYHPSQGFDGYGHMEYVDYLVKYQKLPPPTMWETHQSPLYYLLAASVQSIFGTQKSIQFINIFVFWAIISVVFLGLRKIFPDTKVSLVGVLSLIALPMLNIFQPAISNELLNTFWNISVFVSLVFLYFSKSKQEYNKNFFLLLLSIVFGIWTKVSIVALLPSIAIGLLLSSKNIKSFLFYSLFGIVIFSLAYLPVYLRAASSNSPSNINKTIEHISSKRPLDFYIRLDWIPKTDMYTTQYYSLLGGAWNSFFTDGQNAITPFVPFHKKSFVLWTIGFLLFPISLYGLWQLRNQDKKLFFMISAFGINMLLFYFVYNMSSNHYSAVRLTYQMAIVFPYALGLAGAAKNKKLFPFILCLLLIQFAALVSFFWIEPWWFVTSPKIIG